ncbi:3-keto-5-aminohexanoate cleavage protein [Nocardia sp. NPDC004068]|uniref:3-keto-5-aminohexanoate cleavage protein n=1 Tax=Nocardia sp. NPDC004068 TaxID=3364303 RepID=UPI0036A52CA4
MAVAAVGGEEQFDGVAGLRGQDATEHRRCPPHVRILLHGIDESRWAAMDYERANRNQARIGLEDTSYLRGGELARGNADLVESVVTAEKSEDRNPPDTPMTLRFARRGRTRACR